jgi:hypothetical protein
LIHRHKFWWTTSGATAVLTAYNIGIYFHTTSLLCSCNLFLYNIKQQHGSRGRAAKSGFGPRWKTFFGPPSKGEPARGKVRNQSRQRRTQDGRLPQMPSTRQITT